MYPIKSQISFLDCVVLSFCNLRQPKYLLQQVPVPLGNNFLFLLVNPKPILPRKNEPKKKKQKARENGSSLLPKKYLEIVNV